MVKCTFQYGGDSFLIEEYQLCVCTRVNDWLCGGVTLGLQTECLVEHDDACMKVVRVFIHYLLLLYYYYY